MAQIQINGNLGADPKYAEKGDTQRLELFILENKRKKQPDGTYADDGTLPYNVTLFGKKARIYKDQLQKGMKVIVPATLVPNTFEKKGEAIVSQSIIAQDVAVCPMGVTITKQPSKSNQSNEPDF